MKGKWFRNDRGSTGFQQFAQAKATPRQSCLASHRQSWPPKKAAQRPVNPEL
jgi:hypothetical protein